MIITDWCEIVDLKYLKYKGVLYTTLAQLSEAFIEEVIDESEFDQLFEVMAPLQGYSRRSSNERRD